MPESWPESPKTARVPGLGRALLFVLLLIVAPPGVLALGVNEAAPMPDARLMDGRLLQASELKGKVVLVAFWATWCPVCMRELPDLQKLYQAGNIEIVAVSLDETEKEVRDYLRSAGLSFPVTMANEAWRRSFGEIRGTPTMFLIDRKGVVRGKFIGRLTARQNAEIRALAAAR